MIEEVISTEPVEEQPYKKKVYDILSSSFDDFKLGEQDFYKKLSTDKTYAGKVHDVLIENFSDFKKPKNEFIDSLTFIEPVKKKDGGAISSLTELPSEFIEPLKKGISPNKPKKESLTQVVGGMIIPTNLPKQDEMRYERELKTQDAAINTLTDIYNQKGLKFNPSKPAAQKQIQEYITKARDNDLTQVVGTKDGKEYLVRSQGYFESAGESLVRSITNPIESTSINMTNDASDLADLLDDKIKKEPNIPEATPSKFSGYLGELSGGLPKLMALLAIPYVGESAMVGEMYYNALANQRRFLYEKGLEDGMDRITSAQNAMKNAPLTAIPDAIVAAAMARGIGGKGGSEIISGATKESFLKAVGGGLKGVAKVSAVGGVAEFGRTKTQQAQGYKITNAEAIENGLRGAGDYAIMDAAFKLAHAGPKYLSSAAKNVLSSIPKEIVEVAADNYSDGKQTLEEVKIFANTKAKVADFVPESKVASVTGLTEKTDNLKKDIEALEENKKAVPPSVAVEIDNQIKDKNKEVEFYDNQIKKVLNSKDETGISEEIDDITGERIGTKEIIKAEVKPEEVKVTEEVKPTEIKPSEEKDYNTLYHNSLNENLKLEDIDLLRKGKSQLKRSMKDLPEELQPSGFYTTDDVMSRFMGGTNKYSFKFPKNAKVKDLAAEGRVTDRLGKKELIDLRNQGYDIIKGKNMAGQQEFIPLNKELIKDWKYEGPNIKKENGKYYYTKVTPEGSVQIEVPKNIYESIEKNRFEQITEEVKPAEVDLTSPQKMNASQNKYGIVKDGAEVGFIVATNPENNIVKIKGVTVNEELRGKNIAGDAYVKLGESLAKEGVSLESDSFDKMEPSATRVWEKLADKGLAVKSENSYQFKPTEVKEEVKPTEVEVKPTNKTESFFNDADVMFPNDDIRGGYAVTNESGKQIGRVKMSEVDENTVKIDEVVSEKRGERTGNGSAIMKMVVDNADKNNVKLVLTPNLIGEMKAKGFETADKLRSFYEKFGFVKDKGKATMTREPKEIEVKEEVKPSEIIKNKELQENKLILQNGTKKQGNGKDTGAAIGGEMGGLEPSGKGIEVGIGEQSRYVVGKGNRVVRDATTVKKISIPDSEAAEIKKSLPNAIFDDSFSQINSAEQFHKAISKSLKGNKYSSSVFVYPIEEYKNSRLFLTNDGKAGVAITKDGDIISVFSYAEGKNRVAQLLVNAVKEGGLSLDHYNTILTKFYSQFGFVPVAKVKFDRAEAPKTWDYDLYKDFNNGEPDVIAMAYNGGDPNTLSERVGKFGNVSEILKKTPYVDTWEQAKKLQQEFVNKAKSDLEPSIEKDIKTQIQDFGVPKEDVEPVNAMLSKIHENLKKAGLTATNTLSEWVGIGKGTKEKGALYQPTVYGNSGIVKRPSFDKTSADKAIKSGRVKVISPKESLEDFTFAITHWDDLFVGDIYHDGKKIGSFDGGVFYPLNGGEKGKMGASVNPQSAGAFSTQSNRSLFKNNGIKLPESFEEGTFIVEKGANKNEWVLTNKAGEKVNITMPDNPKPGVIVIGKGDNLKHKSSLSAKVGFVNTLLSYAKNKEGYDGLINAVKSVYSIGNTRNADSVIELFNNYLKSGRMADGQTMSEAKTSYENFRAALIKDANQIVTSMMRDMGYTGSEYFDATQLKKGIYKATGKGIDKMFADIGQEDFLKGLKTGDAYAALKVTSPVFFEKDLGHPSYPFAIKTVDGSPVNIDIFDKTFRTYGENQGIEGRLPKEGQAFTEGFGVTTTTKPSYKLKKDIDLSQPSSSDLSGALGQYESIKRFRKEGEIISKKGEYDYALKQKANAQYRIENGKNIIEALREFNKAKDKGKAVVAITHEIMHPTVVEIINGSKEGNEIGKKYTQTIVDEFNKATDSNITVDELIKGNDEFKNGKTTKQYRDVQEFISESWEKYHTQGAKGFSAEFQKILKTITESFKSVYNSLTEKELTPELKKMFDDILGKSEFKAKKKILSEDISEKQTVVTLPEGADDSYIKMANVVNDAFVGNKFGLDALDQITSKLEDTNLENVIQKVKDKIKLNPNLARETRERLLTTKQGNEFDQAILMYDLARLKGRENELQQEIINTKNPKKIQEYQKEILQVQNEMMDNAMANKQIGRSASTIFRLRQLWVNKELTILDMMDEYKASKGIDELTPEQEQEVKDAYNQIKESRAKLEETKLDLEKSREETAKLMIENQKLKELQEKSNEIKKSERAEKTSETIKKSNERVAKALDNLKKLGGQATAGFDPKIAVELSKIAAEKVYQGIVKFDELVQNVLEDIKDVLPNFTKEDVINHILTRVNKAGQLEPMLLSAQYNNIKKSLDKSKGTLRERVEKYELAQKEVAKQQFKWQEGRRQDMLGNEPIVERIGDKLLRWQRAAVLSYPITMVKLSAVVAHQLIALKPLKFAIGKLVYGLTPKSIREKQSIWGDPKWSSIAKYYSEWVRNFSSTNFKEIMSGVDTKELLYGRPIMYDELNASGSFLEIPGRSHGFIKSFIKNPEFVYAHEQQMVYNLTKMAEITEKLDEPNLTKKQKKALQEEYDSYDVTNEDVIEKINRLALLHSKWAILMNDNKFVEKFRQFTQNTGLVGKIAQSELPIVKIPVNWVGRAFATKYGIIRSFLGKSETETKGKGKLPGLGGTSFPGIAELVFKGTENLTEAQAELLGKSLQLGTMGMAFYALGYYAYKEIEKNEDGSYEIMGVRVPKVLVHIPEYESIISGAETAHKKKEKDQSFIKSYIEADAEIAANNPFLNLLQYGASFQLGKLVTDIANPKKKDVDFTGKASDIMAKKIADMVEPGFVKTAATSFDTKEGKGFHPMGEVIKRRPSGETLDRVWEQFELGIPGLRQNVSKEDRAKRINEITKRLQAQKYDSIRGKIIENLKKIPN